MDKVYKWIIREPTEYNHFEVTDSGTVEYDTEEKVMAYVDGIIENHSKCWFGKWFLSETEGVWTKPLQHGVTDSYNIRNLTHVIIYNVSRESELSIMSDSPSPQRFQCIKRYMVAGNPNQKANAFLMDKEDISNALEYVDAIFELYPSNGWNGQWFYSYREKGWLRFMTKDDKENQIDISNIDHFFVHVKSLAYNHATGHPPMKTC